MKLTEDLVSYLESFLTDRRKLKNHMVLNQRTYHFSVAIEDVYQLHNTSAVMRSCDIFGIQNLHVIEERNSRTIDREIAMGAQKWVDINRYHTTRDCVASLKKEGYQIVATTPHGSNNVNLSEFDFTKKSVFFFGKEDMGLSDYVLENSDVQLMIPMYGFTESLNISVSASIILQEVTRKLRESDLDWKLTDEELLKKRYDWICKVLKSHEQIVARYKVINS